MTAMKGGIEASHLRQFPTARPDRPDRRQIVRLMERGQRYQAREPIENGVIDQRRLGEIGAAMGHAVADSRGQRTAQLLLQPGDGLVQRGRYVCDRARGPSAVDQGLPVLALCQQMRVRADAIDLPLQAPHKSVAANGEQLKLDARAAGVEDQDGLGHRIRPAPAASCEDDPHKAPQRRRKPSVS
jgi:hypothetical protein